MTQNERYKKIPWIYKVTEFFDGENLSKKRLDTISEQAQRFLVYQTMLTLSQYFSVVPDHHSDHDSTENTSLAIKESLNNTLPTWLNGLCDLSVVNIVGGLLDILNMKTEYQKWPPKSVMQFHAVCRTFKPAYYEMKTFSDCKKIGYDDQEKKKKSDDIYEKTMREIYKMQGRDYDKVKKERIKKSSI